jgi:hypothetical protein
MQLAQGAPRPGRLKEEGHALPPRLPHPQGELQVEADGARHATEEGGREGGRARDKVAAGEGFRLHDGHRVVFYVPKGGWKGGRAGGR